MRQSSDRLGARIGRVRLVRFAALLSLLGTSTADAQDLDRNKVHNKVPYDESDVYWHDLTLGAGMAAHGGDLIGDHSLGAAMQGGQRLKDLGGPIMPENLEGRWRWGLIAGYVPYVTGQAAVDDVPVNVGGEQVAGREIRQQIQRVSVGQAAAVLKYPFSTKARLELSAGYRTY